MGSLPVKRALLSVTDKTNLESVARKLHDNNYQLVASGGTARFLRELDIPVTGVSELTGYPEIFGGRVKTLHPVIHGGILGPSADSFRDTEELGIGPIDVVIVNLYNFTAALASGASEPEMVEKIDIGGPTLLRAGAKNFSRVTVLPAPRYYDAFIAELDEHGGVTTREFRRRMASVVFRMVEKYNDAIASWLEEETGTSMGISLRYGENPHQGATLELPDATAEESDLASVGLQQHGGKELSYNNIVDLVAAVKLVGDFESPCCGVLKHTNPCGFGLGPGVQGLERALECDPVSAFGGVFAFNSEINEATAEILAKRFLEIIVAPAYSEAALARLTRKKNVRVLTVDMAKFMGTTRSKVRAWGSLVLRQEEDENFPELDGWDVVSGNEPDQAERTALEMVWKICKHGKSNAIVLGSSTSALGMGFGQMSRVDSVELAIMKAGNQGLELKGAIAASDGFFPFPDGIEKLAAAGIKMVIAPGGSIRDKEVAAVAKDLGITLVLTGRRHFNH
jgi:phosphoribosylaminoimidazolecarboxamide formyltransferase / IMP cyclohydrolase